MRCYSCHFKASRSRLTYASRDSVKFLESSGASLAVIEAEYYWNSKMEEEQADLASLKFGKELEESRCLNLCEVKLLLTDVLKSGKKRSSMAEK